MHQVFNDFIYDCVKHEAGKYSKYLFVLGMVYFVVVAWQLLFFIVHHVGPCCIIAGQYLFIQPPF